MPQDTVRWKTWAMILVAFFGLILGCYGWLWGEVGGGPLYILAYIAFTFLGLLLGIFLLVLGFMIWIAFGKGRSVRKPEADSPDFPAYP